MKNVYIGAESSGVLTTATALYIDGIIDGNFEHIDLALLNGYSSSTPTLITLVVTNSAKLDRSAGSGSGAGDTSSTFRDSYIHYSGILASLTSTNLIKFDRVIFEVGYEGVQITDTFLPAK